LSPSLIGGAVVRVRADNAFSLLISSYVDYGVIFFGLFGISDLIKRFRNGRFSLKALGLKAALKVVLKVALKAALRATLKSCFEDIAFDSTHHHYSYLPPLSSSPPLLIPTTTK
jgi:hypothetical protein